MSFVILPKQVRPRYWLQVIILPPFSSCWISLQGTIVSFPACWLHSVRLMLVCQRCHLIVWMLKTKVSKKMHLKFSISLHAHYTSIEADFLKMELSFLKERKKDQILNSFLPRNLPGFTINLITAISMISDLYTAQVMGREPLIRPEKSLVIPFPDSTFDMTVIS